MDERDIMIKKLNYLKSLAFPYDLELSTIKYENSPNATPIAFSPNLINLSIDGLYKDVFGYVESLSFSIDDTISWSSFNPYMEDDADNRLYPTVVNVSFGMKIIENHSVDKGTVTKYKYDFDGRKEDSIQEPKPTGTGNAIPQPRGVAQMTQLGT
jgi:hypothetical protein